MATALPDRVKAITATTGTGAVTLGAAISPYRLPPAAYQALGLVVPYAIEDTGGAWETGAGVLGYSGGAWTIARGLRESSTGSLLNLSGAAAIAIAQGGLDLVGPDTYTVTGTVTAGQLLAQRSDGTLEPVAGTTNTAGSGAALVYASNSSGYYNLQTFYDTPSGKILVFYMNTSGYLAAVLGTVSSASATTVTWGTPTVSGVAAQNFTANYDSTNGRYLIGVGSRYVLAATVSGSTVTFGTALDAAVQWGNPNGGNLTSIAACWSTSANCGVVVMNCSYGPTAYSFTGTGLTLAWGSANLTVSSSWNAANAGIGCGYDPVNNKVILWASTGTSGSGYYNFFASLTVNSATDIRNSSNSNEGGGGGQYGITFVWLGLQFLIYSATTGNYGSAGYVSSTFSGTAASYVGNAISFTVDTVRNQLVCAYNNSSNSYYLTSCLYNYTSTSPSFSMTKVSGSDLVLASSSSFRAGGVCSLPSSVASKAVVADNSATGNSYLVEPSTITTTNAANYVGVAAASAASGATTTLAPLNSALSGLAGLTPLADYYASASGGLTTTPTYPKVGKALTASKVILTGLAA